MSATDHEATRTKADDSEARVLHEMGRLRWHVITTVYIVGAIVYTAADKAAGGPTLLSIIALVLFVLLIAQSAWLGRPRR